MVPRIVLLITLLALLMPASASAQSLKMKKIIKTQNEALKSEVEWANQKCDSEVTAELDLEGVTPEKLGNYSPAGYCRLALNAMTALCEESLGKEAVKEQVKRVVCSFGERSVELKEGILFWVIDFKQANNMEFVKQYLLNNL